MFIEWRCRSIVGNIHVIAAFKIDLHSEADETFATLSRMQLKQSVRALFKSAAQKCYTFLL